MGSPGPYKLAENKYMGFTEVVIHPKKTIGGVISTHLYWFLGPLSRDHLNFKG